MENNFEKFKRDKDTVASIFKKIKEKQGLNSWEEISNEDFWGEEDEVYGKENNAVDNPYHYTRGRVEAIDVIEDAIKEAPNPMAGFLQGQVLKYMLRLWHKIDSVEDAKKAQWYLNRLIDSLK